MYKIKRTKSRDKASKEREIKKKKGKVKKQKRYRKEKHIFTIQSKIQIILATKQITVSYCNIMYCSNLYLQLFQTNSDAHHSRNNNFVLHLNRPKALAITSIYTKEKQPHLTSFLCWRLWDLQATWDGSIEWDWAKAWLDPIKWMTKQFLNLQNIDITGTVFQDVSEGKLKNEGFQVTFSQILLIILKSQPC